jgi:hypothetical protein
MRQLKAAQGNPDFQQCADCEGAKLIQDAPEIEVGEPVYIPQPKPKKEKVMPKTEDDHKEAITCNVCKKPVLSGGVKSDGNPYRSHPECREKIKNRLKAPPKSKAKQMQPIPEAKHLPPESKKSTDDLCLYLEKLLNDQKQILHALEHKIFVTESAYKGALSAQDKAE